MPNSPNAITVTSPSCSTIVIKWDSNDKDQEKQIPPVHKYVIERLEFNSVVGADSIYDIFAIGRWLGLISSTPSPALQGKMQWTTIYDGKDTIFEDVGLSEEVKYKYRLVAWNLVGHSDYVLFDHTTASSPCGLTDVLDIAIEVVDCDKIDIAKDSATEDESKDDDED